MGNESSIIKLQNFLDKQYLNQDITEYQITESFNKHRDTYDVINLRVYIEDGIVMFSDIDGIIMEYEMSPLNQFLLCDLEYIKVLKSCIKLKFNDGNINIEII